MVSFWYELLCKLSIYTLKRDQWITIWWEKFELECVLLIFIYSDSKFKATCKDANLESGYIKTLTEENPFKISNITFAILPFFDKNNPTKMTF